MAEDRLTILYDWSEAMTAAGDQVKEKVSCCFGLSIAIEKESYIPWAPKIMHTY